MKWHSVTKLLSAMKDRGASWYTRPSMYRHEDRGNLTLPKIENGRGSGDRKVTDQMIEEIIAAFSPGGTGEWHYQD